MKGMETSKFKAGHCAENSSPPRNCKSVPAPAPHHLLPPQEEENILRKSLKEIGEDMKKFEDLITLTEDIIRRERERDREFYIRERRRKMSENSNIPRQLFQVQRVRMASNLTETLQNQKCLQISCTEKDSSVNTEEIKSPLTFRKRLTKRFKRKGSKTSNEQRKNQQETTKSPTFKVRSVPNPARKLIRFSPRKCKSRLYFRNGKIGCIDADNVPSKNIEKTHAIIKYITSDLSYGEGAIKIASITSNISDILSEESAASLDDLPNSILNFDSPTESDDRGIAEDDYFVNSLSDIDSFTVHQNSDDGTAERQQTIELNVKHVDEEMGTENENAQQLACEISSCNFIDESKGNSALNEMEIKPPDSAMSNHSNITLNSEIKNQMHHLVRRFTMRTDKMISRIERPPTPSSTTSSSQSHLPRYRVNPLNIKPNSYVTPTHSPTHSNAYFKADEQRPQIEKLTLATLCGQNSGNKKGVLDPQGSFYISWLCIVSMTFLYNAWVIPLRSTFPFQTAENTSAWMIADFCADIIYLVDIVFIKHRIMFLHEGFWVRDRELTRKNYMSELKFKLDILSLIPLDLLYLKYGTKAVYLRAPRLLKIQSFWEVFRLIDRVIASPYLVRVGRTLTYMLYMIHITACTYYAYSDYQGLGSDRWVFSGKGHPYVRCFAFATKTATSIGKNPKPDSEGELLFMTAAWLMGVFIFALLIGQIRDIIATATRFQTEYRQMVDETLECMRRLNLPKESIDRVKKWFKFTFEQQRTLDENLILDYLPSNLKTDIAIAVHIQTLSKVQLFADCEEALLRELVLKLRSVTFLPDDFVCRKGEIGKEMYIVKWGQVQVMGGPDNDEVLATLTEGSVFGEISLLAINGVEGKRRTADVRSKGFSNLFVLSKSDLNEALAQYPQAQAILKRRAHSVMRKNAARERNRANMSSSTNSVDVVIANPKTPPSPPKLLETVIKALPEESPAVRLLTRGSKQLKKRHENKDITANGANSEPTLNKHKSNDSQILSVENEKLNAPPSPDLLTAIQTALSHRNSFINLTDTEKVLIAGKDKNDISQIENEADFLDPSDGRMECLELKNSPN